MHKTLYILLALILIPAQSFADVTFDFVYADPPGTGFHIRPEAKQALEEAGAELGSWLDHDAILRIHVVSDSFADSNDNLAAAYSPIEGVTRGFYHTAVANKIIHGHTKTKRSYDGLLSVNFQKGRDKEAKFAYGDAIPEDKFDFKTIIFHELTHMLGFLSNIQLDCDANEVEKDSIKEFSEKLLLHGLNKIAGKPIADKYSQQALIDELNQIESKGIVVKEEALLDTEVENACDYIESQIIGFYFKQLKGLETEQTELEFALYVTNFLAYYNLSLNMVIIGNSIDLNNFSNFLFRLAFDKLNGSENSIPRSTEMFFMVLLDAIKKAGGDPYMNLEDEGGITAFLFNYVIAELMGETQYATYLKDHIFAELEKEKMPLAYLEYEVLSELRDGMQSYFDQFVLDHNFSPVIQKDFSISRTVCEQEDPRFIFGTDSNAEGYVSGYYLNNRDAKGSSKLDPSHFSQEYSSSLMKPSANFGSGLRSFPIYERKALKQLGYKLKEPKKGK